MALTDMNELILRMRDITNEQSLEGLLQEMRGMAATQFRYDAKANQLAIKTIAQKTATARGKRARELWAEISVLLGRQIQRGLDHERARLSRSR